MSSIEGRPYSVSNPPSSRKTARRIAPQPAQKVVASAREVLRRTGSSSFLRYVPYSEAYGPGFADLRRRAPDTTKLRETIGYAPHTPLGDILDRVIAHERAGQPREPAVAGLRTED